MLPEKKIKAGISWHSLNTINFFSFDNTVESFLIKGKISNNIDDI